MIVFIAKRKFFFYDFKNYNHIVTKTIKRSKGYFIHIVIFLMLYFLYIYHLYFISFFSIFRLSFVFWNYTTVEYIFIFKDINKLIGTVVKLANMCMLISCESANI